MNLLIPLFSPATGTWGGLTRVLAISNAAQQAGHHDHPIVDPCVPLVVFPGPIFERRFNASKVQESGAGVMVELDGFTVDGLKQAFSKQAQYARCAAQMGESIRSYGGASTALNAIERWVEQKRAG